MKSLSILVVEDDPVNGALLAEALDEFGFTVCPIETSIANAEVAARRWLPDLMIIDVGFSEASGVAVVGDILRSGLIPHVFVTGELLSASSFGSSAMLIQKPFRCSDIVWAIRRALGDAGGPRPLHR